MLARLATKPAVHSIQTVLRSISTAAMQNTKILAYFFMWIDRSRFIAAYLKDVGNQYVSYSKIKKAH